MNNLEIDDRLLTRAMELGGQRTKKAAVTEALKAYIRHLEQEKIIPLFGVMEYDPGYDYKEFRGHDT